MAGAEENASTVAMASNHDTNFEVFTRRPHPWSGPPEAHASEQPAHRLEYSGEALAHSVAAPSGRWTGGVWAAMVTAGRGMGRNIAWALVLAIAAVGFARQGDAKDLAVQQVAFPSADGRTQLVGYLFIPDSAAGRAPAIVLMHGRSGAYTKGADGDYSARTLRRRDETWARLWRARGYEVLIVDSFGPRGYPAGFAAGTHDERPPSVDEVQVRPFDAYGALAFLQARPEVAADRIGLMGWSNGASATLASVAQDGVASGGRSTRNGFRAALAFYPGCGLNRAFDRGYRPYAFVKIFIGTADEEVSPDECRRLAAKNATLGGGVDLIVYPGATHDFDDPANHRQDNPANVSAKADATSVAVAFFEANLRP